METKHLKPARVGQSIVCRAPTCRVPGAGCEGVGVRRGCSNLTGRLYVEQLVDICLQHAPSGDLFERPLLPVDTNTDQLLEQLVTLRGDHVHLVLVGTLRAALHDGQASGSGCAREREGEEEGREGGDSCMSVCASMSVCVCVKP